jgi:peptidoglycan/LPS O-acetylase OafA/YrhL
MVLPMFFCLSGVLVAGSAARIHTLDVFLVFRILRILPALIVEVTLSAFVLGPLVTRYSLDVYFGAKLTYQYFGNIIGDLSFMLPGVFKYHPIQMVNLNLWTLVPELYCYVIMIILFTLGILHNRKWFLLCFLQGTIMYFLLSEVPVWLDGPLNQYLLMICFFIGCLTFMYAEYIPIHKGLFVLCAVLAYISFTIRDMAILGIVCMAYCTLFLGMVKFPRVPFLEKGDYSYGVYLYGFPITQTIWHYIPTFRYGWILFGLSAPVTLAFAAFSWHFIEKPALRLKRVFLAQKQG